MTSQISSLTGLTLIDTTNTSGSINLPQISGQVGRILTFKDSNNNFANSTCTLYTAYTDSFEDGTQALTLLYSGESITLIAGEDNVWYQT
ncbi:MAG: hypothetical protein EB127_18785, partial [Alphaproteobacteria bacterium]|nr:hypothetical protein [Alphaproteobacteria bacterium]